MDRHYVIGRNGLIRLIEEDERRLKTVEAGTAPDWHKEIIAGPIRKNISRLTMLLKGLNGSNSNGNGKETREVREEGNEKSDGYSPQYSGRPIPPSSYSCADCGY